MKVRLKNNTNLQLQTVQNKTSIESLYITGCPRINAWNIFSSIYETTGNKLRSIRLDGVNHTGTWSELQALKSNLHGLDPNGNETNVPVLIGTWTLPGMHIGEHDLTVEEAIWGGTLEIEVDKTLITFTDPAVNSIVNSLWGFEYDSGLYGVDTDQITTIYTIGQNFSENPDIVSFLELESFINITQIDSAAFQDCTSLEAINLPSQVTKVGDNAFSGCSSLQTLVYPESVSQIGDNQTTGCTSLEYVRIMRDTTAPSIQANSFDGDFPIYVGDGSSPYHDNQILELLKSTNAWKPYAHRLDTWYNKIYSDLVPSGYKKLDYIESDASNYLETDLSFTDTTRFVADISFDAVSSMGIYGSSDSGLKGIPGSGLKFTVLRNGSEYTSTISANNADWLNSIEHLYDINLKDGVIMRDGGTVYSNQSMKSNGGNITLFGDSSNKFIGKTWMTRIYNNGTLVSDFVPIYKESTSEAGLWDCVKLEFHGYTSYSGKGYDTRLLSEDNSRLTTDLDDRIVVSNLNTERSKVSRMSDGDILYENYWMPVTNGVDTKKLALTTIDNMVGDFMYRSGVTDFAPAGSYVVGDYVKYQGAVYKFITNHRAGSAWNLAEVERTFVLRELEKLHGLNNDCQIHIKLIPKNEYLELESLVSSGTQWIDTGVPGGNNNLRIELKFKYSATSTPSSGTYLLGNYVASSNMTRIYLAAGNIMKCGLNTSGEVSVTGVTPGEEHTLVLTSENITLDETGVFTNPTTQGTANDTNLAIFADKISSATATKTGLEVYYLKIYNGTTLIRDFRPYSDTYTKGLRDMCAGGSVESKEFYTNSGTGVFGGTYLSSNPVAYKSVYVKPQSKYSDTINLRTDENGECDCTVRRDTAYTVTAESITGYTKEQTKLVMFSDNDNTNLMMSYKKTPGTNYKTITLNLTVAGTGSDIGVLASKYIYLYQGTKTFSGQILSVSGTTATAEFSVPAGSNGLIVFPIISGYERPGDQEFTTIGENLVVNKTYNIE